MSTQANLNNYADRLKGKSPVRIHFLDNSSKIFLVENQSTARDVVVMVLEKYDVDPKNIDFIVPYYALYESKEGSLIDGAIPLDSNLLSIVRSWGTNENADAKLVFMIRLYLPSINGLQYLDVIARRSGVATKETRDFDSCLTNDQYLSAAEIIDHNVLQIQYIQAVYNVITGAYSTTEEKALELGSLHFLLKFGDFNPDTHVVGFLDNRIVEFIPIRHLRKEKKSLKDWEADLLRAAESLSSENHEITSDIISLTTTEDESNDNLAKNVLWQRKYLNSVYRMDLYGCTFFRCQQKATRYTPENPILGIYYKGIIVFDKQRKIHKRFHMAEISEWGYKPEVMFNFQVKLSDDMEAFIEFQTPEGKTISDLLTDYALAYIKEREAEEARSVKSVSTIQASTSKSMMAKKLSSTATLSSSSSSSAAAVKSQSQKAPVSRELQESSAILIQAAFRGYTTRAKVGLMIIELMKNGELDFDDDYLDEQVPTGDDDE